MGLEKIGIRLVQKSVSLAKQEGVSIPQTLNPVCSKNVNSILTKDFLSELNSCQTKEEFLQLAADYKSARMNGSCIDNLTSAFQAREIQIKQKLNSKAKLYFEGKAAENQNHFIQHAISRPQVETFLANSNGDYDLLYRIVNSKYLSFKDSPSALTRILSAANKNTLDFLSKYTDGKIVLKKLDNNGNAVNIKTDDLASIIQFNRNNKNIEDLVLNPNKLTVFLKRSEQIIDRAKQIDFELYSALKNNVCCYQNVGFNAKVNNNLLDDMEALVHGKNYYPRFPGNSSSLKILQETKLGDVVAIDGKMYLNNGKKMEQLVFTEKTYQELFPPISRYNIKQGKIGNCYFVSQLEALMNNNKGRCYIYKMFKQDAVGNLLVQTAKNNSPIIIDNLPQNMPYLRNNKGLACIELAYGAGAKNQNVSKLSQITELMPEAHWIDGGSVGLKSLIGDGCNVTKYSFDCSQIMKTLRQNLDQYANREDYLLQMSFAKLNPKYNILNGHTYSVRAYNPINNTITIANPHRAGIDIVVPVNELGSIQKFSVTSI